MLVLTRKAGERVVVPELGLEIVVLAVLCDRVRLGFEGPPDCAVHRLEVWRKIEQGDGRPRESGGDRP